MNVLVTLIALLPLLVLSTNKPICAKIGSPYEGWYWENTGSPIQYTSCASDAITCNFVGTGAEGWYANNKYLVAVGTCAPKATGAPCSTNDDCETTYCANNVGECSAIGNCTEYPLRCTKDLRPVCGCDGRNYSNPCMAALNSTSVDYMGWCQDQFDCESNSDCSVNSSYCSKDDTSCASQGICLAIPHICITIYRPVCGCDGISYDNPCTAKSNGTNVDYFGECTPRDKCFDSNECGPFEFCRKAEGECAVGIGDCVMKPTLCSMQYDPVCGCDHVTYANVCVLFASGNSALHKDAC